MTSFTLIDISWNKYNDFIFTICLYDDGIFERKLFGVAYSKNYCIVDLFFKEFVIFENYE